MSAREQAAIVSILGDAENYLNIDGLLWSIITLKVPPDGTYPGILRSVVDGRFSDCDLHPGHSPDQRAVLDKYKKRLKKMQAAQIDSKGNRRVDIEAQVHAGAHRYSGRDPRRVR